ncbi:DUF4012 domain-containing protein [Patescibacteria group bacterium]
MNKKKKKFTRRGGASKKRKTVTHQAKSSANLPTALVAGAAGFIGSHLCEALIHQNCKVFGLDNWTTGKKENIKDLLKNDNFVFLEHDLNKPIKSPMPQVDYIFHLAGVEAYVNGLDVSLETLLVNSLGSRELLEIAKDKHTKFLLASTTDIFSGHISTDDLSHYFGLSHHNQEAYSHHEAKRFSEALTFEYVNRHHLDARIVRLGNVYGPRMDLQAGNEITRLFTDAKKGTVLKLSNQGLTQLYPTYISDIVYGLTKAMFSQSSQSKIFTLINPEKTTTLNLAYKLKQLIKDKDLKIEFTPDSEAVDVVNLSEKILDSQKELGWQSSVDLEEGIQKTYSWLKSGKAHVSQEKDYPSTIDPQSHYTAEDLGIEPAKPPSPEPPLPASEKKQKKILKLQAPKFKIPALPKPQFNLKNIFSFKKDKTIKLSLESSNRPSSKKTKALLLLFLALVFYIIAPMSLMAGFAYKGAQSLNKASQITDYSQTDKLIKLTQSARNNFEFSRRLLTHARFPLKIVGQKVLADNLDRLLFIGIKLSQGAEHLSQAGDSGTLLSEIIFHHQDANLTEALKRIKINLDQAYTELSFVESELQSGKELSFDPTTSLAQKFQQLTTKLPEARGKINQARAVLPLIPSFIAQDSKKTYLLLFQNSAEIRPTGGFIGSYGLLTFDKGKLLDFSVEDIYSADGQLKGYVEPPEPIKEFLGQNTWYFRDSNWDPDFPISAERAEWFLNKTTSRNVDGVIAINLPAVKELLKATGTIELSDYNEEVTADNLFDRAEYHSEIDFFPGSTQKKDFLGSLAREIFDKFENMTAGDLLKFAESFEVALAQKQILVYLHDQNAQKILLEQNWAGAIFEPNLATLDNRPVTADYSYLVEANLGINKANYFLKRNIQHQLTILKNRQILVITTISYQNQSPADAWPGGIYRTYLRDYIPSSAKLISIKTGEDKLSSGDIDQEVIGDKRVLGFPVTVPVKNSLDVEITYRLNQALEMNNNLGRLSIVIPKQPGITEDTLEVIVNHPTYLATAATSPQALVSPQVITFKSDYLTDRVFNIDFVER